MFELSDEKVLMVSSDNKVKLTTHRVMHEDEKGRQQVMLEDFQHYKYIDRSIHIFQIIFFIYLLFLGILIANYLDSLMKAARMGFGLGQEYLRVFISPSMILFYLIGIIVYRGYKFSRIHIIQINGKYNSFEFRVKKFKHPSVQKMLTRLQEQSEIIKQKAQNNSQTSND